jgi:hypothetical protein
MSEDESCVDVDNQSYVDEHSHTLQTYQTDMHAEMLEHHTHMQYTV